MITYEVVCSPTMLAIGLNEEVEGLEEEEGGIVLAGETVEVAVGEGVEVELGAAVGDNVVTGEVLDDVVGDVVLHQL